MKKIISFILALCLCFIPVFSSSAAEINTQQTENQYEEIVLTEEKETDENTDIFNSLEEIFPTEENEELDKIISLAEMAATFIYNYATQPEEPAVSLETVVKVVRLAVTVIYTLIQNYG